MEPKAVEDDVGAQRTLREAHDRQVPAELVRQLHEANGRADGLRRQLAEAAGRAEQGVVERTQKVGDDLRAAEREIEDISQRIRDASPPQAKGS